MDNRRSGQNRAGGHQFLLVLSKCQIGITIPGMTTISLKISESLARRLKDEAKSRRTSCSAIVRDCLEQASSPGAGIAPT